MSHRFKTLSRGRVAERGVMNKTEREYAELLAADPDVYKWWFEPFSLRLSTPPNWQPARYTPDFLVLMNDGVTFVDDVKGSGIDNEASIVRLKCAAETYPLWRFRLAKKAPKRDGGGFLIKEV